MECTNLLEISSKSWFYFWGEGHTINTSPALNDMLETALIQ